MSQLLDMLENNSGLENDLKLERQNLFGELKQITYKNGNN